MSISAKTRKTLWARSGNRCAICKTELVTEQYDNDKNQIIGEECHIISSKGKGPRYKSISDNNYDIETNLILLCRNHHREIDEQIDTYTAQAIQKIKSDHEIWVKRSIDETQINIEYPQPPELDEEIKPILDKIKKLIDIKQFDEAEKKYEKAEKISDDKNDEYSKAMLQKQYAIILKDRYYDNEKADEVLIKCLQIFEKCGSHKDAAIVKGLLGQIKSDLGDYVSAELYAKDYLEFAKTKKDFYEIASAYIIIGYIEIQHHQYDEAFKCWDEAIKCGVRLTKSQNNKEKENGIYVISLGNHNKSFIFKMKGNIAEAKSCCLKAIEGHRKLNKKEELAKLLFEMTEIECAEGNFSAGKWKEYIDEAKAIFRELHDYSSLARCIDLVSRIAYTLGQKDLSLQIFKEGYEEIKKTKDKEGVAYYLKQFATFHIRQKNYDEAEKYLDELVKYAKSNNLHNSLIRAYEVLADIEGKKGNIEKRDTYLNIVLTALENEYNQEQSLAKKANILGEIGDTHTQQGNFRESLPIFEQIAKIYKDLKEIGGFAKATLIVAELNMQLGNRESAFNNWQKVSNVVKGTAFHEFASIAKINSGSFLIRTGDYETAQRYLAEAQHLISKYRLKHSSKVEYLLKEIDDRRDITSPPERTFSYMVNRLYAGITKKPEAVEPLLRHWYSKYEKDLFRYFYNQSGLKCVLYTDDMNTINSLSNSFSWLYDYFLIASNEKFKQDGYDLVVYPYEDIEAGEHIAFVDPKNNKAKNISKQSVSSEEQILMALNKPSNDGKLPRYVFMPTKFGDEVKIVLAGWGKGLPSITYDFLDKFNAEDIISGNRFVLNIDRYTARDILFSDVLFCWQMGYLPIYINEELSSEDVLVLTKLKVEIPMCYSGDKIKAANAKKIFNNLFQTTRDNAKSVLNEFKLDMDILFNEEINKMAITISIIEVKYFVQKIIYPVMFLNEKLKPITNDIHNSNN